MARVIRSPAVPISRLIGVSPGRFRLPMNIQTPNPVKRAKGVQMPILTAEQMVDLGQDWHVFPNHIMISGPNGCLAYRGRPNGHDPDTAIWDVFSLLRFPAGEEPNPTPQRNDDLSDETFWPLILRQDFDNLNEIQQGMKSRGFRGARPNPVQEVPVSNFHRGLRKFMGL